MDAKLILVVKGKPRKEIPLQKAVTIIGRARECDVQVPLALVSRRHCQIVMLDDSLTVKDGGSSNGTFVNGKRVKQRQLSPGDELTVGPARFRVEFEGAPVAAIDDEGDSGVVAAVVDDESADSAVEAAAVAEVDDDQVVAAEIVDDDEDEVVAAAVADEEDEPVVEAAEVIDDDDGEDVVAAAIDPDEGNGIPLEEAPEDVVVSFLEDEVEPVPAAQEKPAAGPMTETTDLSSDAEVEQDEAPTQKIDILGSSKKEAGAAASEKPTAKPPPLPAKPSGRTNTDLDELDDEELDSFLDSLNTLSDDEDDFDQRK